MKSFVMVNRVTPNAGNIRSSPATGAVPLLQFAPADQLPLELPSQALIAPKLFATSATSAATDKAHAGNASGVDLPWHLRGDFGPEPSSAVSLPNLSVPEVVFIESLFRRSGASLQNEKFAQGLALAKLAPGLVMRAAS
jgi:hypothetical protein